MGTIENLVEEIHNHCAAQDREIQAETQGCAAIYRDLDWANCLAGGLGGVAEMLHSQTSPSRCDEIAGQLLCGSVQTPEELTSLGRALVSVVLGYRAQAARRQRDGQTLVRQARRLDAVLHRLALPPRFGEAAVG